MAIIPEQDFSLGDNWLCWAWWFRREGSEATYNFNYMFYRESHQDLGW